MVLFRIVYKYFYYYYYWHNALFEGKIGENEKSEPFFKSLMQFFVNKSGGMLFG